MADVIIFETTTNDEIQMTPEEFEVTWQELTTDAQRIAITATFFPVLGMSVNNREINPASETVQLLQISGLMEIRNAETAQNEALYAELIEPEVEELAESYCRELTVVKQIVEARKAKGKKKDKDEATIQQDRLRIVSPRAWLYIRRKFLESINYEHS